MKPKLVTNSLSAIRGAMLEEVILSLLQRLGFRTIVAGDEGTHAGRSGLEVQGRGERHQIDAFAAFDFTPAFVYPLRLLFEAKCYRPSSPVGIEVVRNAVGVLKDISENYFSSTSGTTSAETVKVARFNYVSAIFSTSGFTANAQRYALAHQIFLVQYQHNRLFGPISEGLLSFRQNDFVMRDGPTKALRQFVRAKLNEEELTQNPFTPLGLKKFNENVAEHVRAIGGSYFGMLQGRWPIHLLSSEPLPARVFADSDEVMCKVYGRESNRWSFVPRQGSEGSDGWFRLDFDLPEEIAQLVQNARGDAERVANTKMKYFSFITLSGMIGGVRRQIRLKMDQDWIKEYLEKSKATKARNQPSMQDQ
jgi:hypothetical protein